VILRVSPGAMGNTRARNQSHAGEPDQRGIEFLATIVVDGARMRLRPAPSPRNSDRPAERVAPRNRLARKREWYIHSLSAGVVPEPFFDRHTGHPTVMLTCTATAKALDRGLLGDRPHGGRSTPERPRRRRGVRGGGIPSTPKNRPAYGLR